MLEVSTLSSFKKNIEYATIVLLFAIFTIILWRFFSYAVVAPPSFDGALNMNTAASFLAGDGYGFRYTIFFPFPAQSDGPLILPSALAMAVLGRTALAMQIVNLLYVVALAAVACLLVRHVGRQVVAAVLAAIFALSMPGFSEFAMNGFGEIPVAALGVASILMVALELDQPNTRSKRLFVAGLLVGFCFITKSIAAIFVISVLGSAVLFLFLKRPWRFAPIIALLVGSAIPVLGWEIFRAIELGGLRPSANWWQLQLWQAAAQSGGRRSSLGLISSKLPVHLDLLAAMLGVSPSWLPTLLLMPLAIGAWLLLTRKTTSSGSSFAILALMGTSAGYFAWWLMIVPTEMAWLRRIQIGLAIHAILVVMLAGLLWRVAHGSVWRATFSRGVAIVLIALFVVPVWKGQIATRDLSLPQDVAQGFELANAVRALPPDATLFGFDWWKAPVISLFSGRNIENLNQWDPNEVNRLSSRYLVVDRYAAALGRADFLQIERRADLRLVMENAGGRLYEIVALRPYPAFTDADRDASNLPSTVGLYGGSLQFLRGVYHPDGEFAWTNPEFAMLLRRTTQTELNLRFGIHPAVLAQRGVVTLRINSPGCIETSVDLDRPWFQELSVTLTCPPTDQPVSMEIMVDVNGQMPFPRQIDMDGRRLSLLFSGATLQTNGR